MMLFSLLIIQMRDFELITAEETKFWFADTATWVMVAVSVK